MKQLFDEVSRACSRITTKTYSTSFSLGISFLHKRLQQPIYSIYGFVRLADEIVDSFHDYPKALLLQEFKQDVFASLRNKISLNPILNAFQETAHQYQISEEWIRQFLDSMEMDLNQITYSQEGYQHYILGSAEAVGLMCLHVFTEGDMLLFEELKPFAMKLGSAFQKVNFLRDVKADKEELGRTYFPGIDLNNFSANDKQQIEADIDRDFFEALEGIKRLPKSSRNGVYLAYYYYTILFGKIKRLPPHRILKERIRIPNYEKLLLMFSSNIRHQLNLL
jgi:15-cis-phytoene synthase